MEDCEEVISTEAPSNSTEASTELPTTLARVVVPTEATTATRVVDNEETTCLPCEHYQCPAGQQVHPVQAPWGQGRLQLSRYIALLSFYLPETFLLYCCRCFFFSISIYFYFFPTGKLSKIQNIFPNSNPLSENIFLLSLNFYKFKSLRSENILLLKI